MKLQNMKTKWYNWRMSRISNKPNWQSDKFDHTHIHDDDDFKYAEEQMDKKNTENNEITKQVEEQRQAQTGLDMNLVVACFQEKLAQLTTELVVKEATIKQLTNIINSMKGDK